MRKPKKKIGFYLASAWIGIILFMAIFGPLLPLPKWDASNYDLLGAHPFTGGHIFGTTMDGYDELAGIVHGARISVMVGLVTVLVGGTIGSAIGICAAYFRGKLDAVVNLFFNVVLSIPNLVLSLALISVLAYSDSSHPASNARRILVLMISLSIVVMPILGRIARGAALQWSSREFILASKSMGTKSFDIIRRHILPNVAPAILAIAFLAVGVVIIAEGSLAILGIGVPGGASWGSMLANGRGNLQFSPHEVYMPIIFIAGTVISTNYFGDYVRNSLDRREAKI